jgi:hypothetical protein
MWKNRLGTGDLCSGGKMTRGITVVATMSSVMESSGTPVPSSTRFQAQVYRIWLIMCHFSSNGEISGGGMVYRVAASLFLGAG